MTRPVLAPPTPGLSLQRLEIALLCVHVLQKHDVEIDGLGARELFLWAGVPEEHLSPEFSVTLPADYSITFSSPPSTVVLRPDGSDYVS